MPKIDRKRPSKDSDSKSGQATNAQKLPQRGKTRKDILQAAIHEFAQAGFTGASTLEIAKRAKSKQPLLNYHFGSKEKLWQAAVDYGFAELSVTFDTIDEIAKDLEEIDVLKLMLRTLNRFASRNPLHIVIVQQEMGSDSTRTQYLLAKYLTPMYRRTNKVIEAAITKGQIKDIPPQFLSSMLFSAITHYYSAAPTMKAVYATDINNEKQAKMHGDWLTEVIFEGLKK